MLSANPSYLLKHTTTSISELLRSNHRSTGSAEGSYVNQEDEGLLQYTYGGNRSIVNDIIALCLQQAKV